MNAKVYVVTGGASGLGRGAAEVLLEEGARVTIIDVNEPNFDNGLGKCDDRLLFIKADVSSESEAQKALEDTKKKFGKIDGLVHCAGICRLGDVIYDQETKKPGDLGIYTKIITVNLLGTLNMNRLVIPFLVENKPDDEGQRGIIINTSSATGHDGVPSMISYSATKAAIVSLTYPLAKDLAPLGIRVMDIAPGVCETPMLLKTAESNPAVALMTNLFPKRMIKLRDFGRTVKDIIGNPMLNGFSQRLDGALRN